jgi:hypothetical protein
MDESVVHFEEGIEAASEHAGRQLSADFKNYDKMVEKVQTETRESQLEHHDAFVATPADITGQLHELDRVIGGVDHASLQVTFNDMPYADAEKSVRLCGEKVIPHFAAERMAR